MLYSYSTRGYAVTYTNCLLVVVYLFSFINSYSIAQVYSTIYVRLNATEERVRDRIIMMYMLLCVFVYLST